MKYRYSYSRLKDYERCPFYFHKRHLEKLPVEANEDLTKGSVVHDILANYTLECYQQGVTHKYDTWEAIAQKVMEKHIIPADWEEDILKPVKEYVEANEIELDGLVGVEEKIAIDSDFNIVAWEDENVWFRAVLDRLYIVDDQCKIKDYKTGFSLSPDLFQLEVYAWLIYKTNPQVNFVKAEFDFTRFAWTKDWDIPKTDLKKIQDKIMRRVRQVEKDTEFNPKVSSACSNCPFWQVCPAIQAIGQKNLIRYPDGEVQAKKLLQRIIARDKELSELKKILKSYVEDNGSVVTEDMIAHIKPTYSKEWDVGALLAWANKKGYIVIDALNVDNRKIKKFIPIEEVPQEYFKTKLGTRFTIANQAEEINNEN